MIPVILDFDQHRKRKPNREPIIREDPINLDYTVTFLCLSQTRTWIYNAICRGLFCVKWFEIGDGCWFVFSGLRYKRWLLVLLILEEWLFKLFFYNGTFKPLYLVVHYYLTTSCIWLGQVHVFVHIRKLSYYMGMLDVNGSTD